MCTYLHNFLYSFQVFHGTEKEAAYRLFLPEIMELVAQIEIQPVKISICLQIIHYIHIHVIQRIFFLNLLGKRTGGASWRMPRMTTPSINKLMAKANAIVAYRILMLIFLNI